MERRTFDTPLGEIWLWGDWRDAPYLLVLAGMNADPEAYRGLVGALPVPVRIGHVPGYNCPRLDVQSVGAFAAAYGHVARALGQPFATLGVSLGATVAMAMRSPDPEAILALEPIVSTGGAWPVQELLKPRSTDERDMLWSTFGIAGDRHVDRDYSGVLQAMRRPCRVLLSDEPLGAPRPLPRMPSLVGDADRAKLQAHPLISLSIVAGAGHDLGDGASNVIRGEIDRLLVQSGISAAATKSASSSASVPP
jgi:hypothetical protein